MKASHAAVDSESKKTPLALLKQQRSHNLFLMSNAQEGNEDKFTAWYKETLLQGIAEQDHVLSVQGFEQHEVDITQGHFRRPNYHYLSLIELSLDGANEAASLIDHITVLHQDEASADDPAAWLYYPLGEMVGRNPETEQPLMTLAYANAVKGKEDEFREWYTTRHIRHALNLPEFVSGQCFALSEFQRYGAAKPEFSVIAIYQQEGSPKALLDSFNKIVPGTLVFPSLDTVNFSEWIYQPVTERLCGLINGQ